MAQLTIDKAMSATYSAMPTQHLPTIVFIFGASGDLAYRKLMPAIFNLSLDDLLPEKFRVVGISRSEMTNASLLKKYLEGIRKFSRRKPDRKKWGFIRQNFDYFAGDFADPKLYERIDRAVASFKEENGITKFNVIIYLAVAPGFFEPITRELAKYSFVKRREYTRFVYEKPFGHDLESAIKLNRDIRALLKEEQIFRIDHYLGKETVQNILAFRFANTFFEPLWNKNYIEWVQISALEKVGLEGRGAYYDQSGAMRDMVQNHMFQLLCMIAMEPPISFDPNEVRNKKAEILTALRKYEGDEVFHHTVRGQYKGGINGGHSQPAYRAEPNVAPDSTTETYAAARFFVDTWRWSGVPFYIRTGKNLLCKATYIAVKFKAAPNYTFPKEATHNWESNLLVIYINPKMDINLSFQAKVPGQLLQLNKVNMLFDFKEELTANTPEAYEHLLYDVLENDPTLFMRSDQVEAAWSVIDPILKAWQEVPATEFPNYNPGTTGPVKADELLAESGHTWLHPADNL